LALAEAGVPFRQPSFDLGDPVATGEYFQKARELGGNLTTNIPMLYMDGKYLTQSTAILKTSHESATFTLKVHFGGKLATWII
jgi:hypothetical protein